MTDKKTILILGAGIYQVPLIKEAKKQGLRTIVASIPGNYPGFALADKIFHVNTTDKEAVLKIAIDEKIDAITTTGTDVAVISIGYVCSKLGLSGISFNAARIMTDKALMKEAFVKGEVTTAPFFRVSSFDEVIAAIKEIGFPCVLKIVDKSGSRGITKLSDWTQLEKAYKYAESATDADHMIVEKFINGVEIGVDAFVQNGELKYLIPHEKLVYHSAHSGVPIGHICPMDCSELLYKNIKDETKKIIHATGADNCAINIDAFVLPNESVSIIEAAGRCGATGIPEVISGYTGKNYYECIINTALGYAVEGYDAQYGTPTASMLILSEKVGILNAIHYQYCGKEYLNDSINVPGRIKVDLDVKPGESVRSFSNGTDRLGMFVMSAKSKELLLENIRLFHKSIKVDLD